MSNTWATLLVVLSSAVAAPFAAGCSKPEEKKEAPKKDETAEKEAAERAAFIKSFDENVGKM